MPPTTVEDDVPYIPLKWKEDWLKKKIIPCSYHTFNNIWHRLHIVKGVRDEDATRPYSLRVGAGNRLSGTYRYLQFPST